jgi:serine protease Do
MRRGRVALLVLAAAVGGGLAHALHATETSAAPTAVTPKMQAPPEARSLSRAFSSVAKALQPSVVRLDIETEKPRVSARDRRNNDRERGRSEPDLRDFFERFFEFGEGGGGQPFPQPGPGRGTGSGVLLDTKGYILTNYHVVNKATKVTVMFSDGRELPAKVVGLDDKTDVAVVQLEKPPANLVAARLGDSDKVEIGEWVLAVGSPLGMDQTVTAGIVSSKGKIGRNRTMQMSGEKMFDYIQTDAKINPGNSGGPLVNLEGEVIAINTLINTGPGGAYGFAIPVNQARRVAETLIKEGRMRYAYLGVSVGDLRAAAEERGESPNPAGPAFKLPPNAPKDAALVNSVTPNGPAAKAGLRAGDIITKIDSQTIEGSRDVVQYVSAKPVGSRVTVSYLREGKPSSMQVVLGEYPSDPESLLAAQTDVQREAIGVQLQDLTSDIAGFLGLPSGTKGAIITEVTPGSRAARAGLKAEDVILEVNRKSINSASGAAAAFKENPAGVQYLRIRRGNGTRLVTVPGK